MTKEQNDGLKVAREKWVETEIPNMLFKYRALSEKEELLRIRGENCFDAGFEAGILFMQKHIKVSSNENELALAEQRGFTAGKTACVTMIETKYSDKGKIKFFTASARKRVVVDCHALQPTIHKLHD